jgi:hypothetical protein
MPILGLRGSGVLEIPLGLFKPVLRAISHLAPMQCDSISVATNNSPLNAPVSSGSWALSFRQP